MSGDKQLKWYESPETETGVIVSSRVRLARNLDKYPFPSRISEGDERLLLNSLRDSVVNARSYISRDFGYAELKNLPDARLLELMEKHALSREAVANKNHAAFLKNTDESMCVMLNEEDHLRIQAVFPGENIERAYEAANNLDNLIEESVAYAFDVELGYLTACPTNTGTGLRASYMLHLPSLEAAGLLKNILTSVTKLGYTLRGSHGEGTASLGGIYQLSNQLTLGKSENESIRGLKSLAIQISRKEIEMHRETLAKRSIEAEDAFQRALAILRNCRKIGLDEAMEHLSQLRLRHIYNQNENYTNDRPVYDIMLDIQPWSLRRGAGTSLDQDGEDIRRADVLRCVAAMQV